MPQVLGESLFARDGQGRLVSRIATIFPQLGILVTLPGIHATQRLALLEMLSRERESAGKPPLSEAQQNDILLSGVDLIVDEDAVLIRPDPQEMPLAFDADELLQRIVPKTRIKFLHVLDPRVRDAIKQRGECWRISPLPRSPEQMKQMIASSRIGIGGREIYFYNRNTGTRLLTYENWCGLSSLPDDVLRQHLLEIHDFCGRTNRIGRPEVDFFMADGAMADIVHHVDVGSLQGQGMRNVHQELAQQFCELVQPEYRRDDTESACWRSRMYAALIGETDQEISEEKLLGLSDEFFMQVEWLPGARIEDGELLLDPLFEDESNRPACPPEDRHCDDKALGFIFNFIRDYGDLEFVNIGRVVGSLSHRKFGPGRRGVYLAEIKHRAAPKPVLRIIRLQKWGVADHLDEGKDLLTAILQAEEYTEYIQDRRLGCRQLGMNLTRRVVARKVSERYNGCNRQYQGQTIWTSYFERDYVPGLATDKIPPSRFASAEFCTAFARMLGRAAAPNLILGRTDAEGKVIFDDGDELVVENAFAMPVEMIVADHTGTFSNYRGALADMAPAYAQSIIKRKDYLPDVRAFTDAFLLAFEERLAQVQRDYAKRKRAFDTLFKHRRRDEGGSFAYRWERVLERLAAANGRELSELIRRSIRL